jgi:hypothetical protein
MQKALVIARASPRPRAALRDLATQLGDLAFVALSVADAINPSPPFAFASSANEADLCIESVRSHFRRDADGVAVTC